MVEAEDAYFSVLRQQDNAIRLTFGKRLKYATVLVALSEEPCYVSELPIAGLSKVTAIEAIKYMVRQGLVMECFQENENLSEQDREVINKKLGEIRRKLPENLWRRTAERIIFYKIAKRGQKFLDFAKAICIRAQNREEDNTQPKSQKEDGEMSLNTGEAQA